MPRRDLGRDGYVWIANYRDLYGWGVKVYGWLNPENMHVVLEYATPRGWLYAETLDEQIEVHRALGIPAGGVAGEPWDVVQPRFFPVEVLDHET